MLAVLERYASYVKFPVRSRWGAAACLVVACFCVLVWVSALATPNPGTLAAPLAYTLLVVGIFCYVVGRRLWLPDAISLLRNDPRPPVLYLRAFKHDVVPNSRNELATLLVNAVVGGVFSFLTLIGRRRSMEARIWDVLWSVGPVLTVARPDEILNLRSACRVRLDDTKWQEVVEQLIAAAGLVVVDASDAPGLRWEIESAANSNRSNLVFAITTGRVANARTLFVENQINDIMKELFGHHLPDTQQDLAFITFANGSPVEHRLTRGLSVSRVLGGRLRTTLAEVLQGMGRPAKVPLIRRPLKLAAWTLLVVFVLGTSASARRAVQEQNEEVETFFKSDAEWRADFNRALSNLSSRRSSTEQTASYLEKHVLPELDTEMRRLLMKLPLRNDRTIVVRDAMTKHQTAIIDAVKDFAAAVRTDDYNGARTALEAIKAADDRFKELTKAEQRR